MNNYGLVLNYLSKMFNLNKKKLSIDTSLSDLGLDGDDVLDFLVSFFKDFGIDYEQTNYKDFIPPESGFFLNTILSIFNRKRSHHSNEIYIRDLIESLDNKRWSKSKS